MKYIGNYKEWINSEWLTEVLSSNGFEGKIVVTSVSNKDRYAEYQKAISAGYNTDTIYWWRYTNEITTFDIVNPPWINSTNKLTWWIVKQLPGQIQPMHVDVDKTNNCRRYWIPLQDYEPGHIIVNENKLITNYITGDVYEFDTPLDYHGSANISFIPRVVLLITEHL